MSALPDIPWKVGFEIELMAPPGASRQTLAERLATDIGGTSTPYWHVQSEPSRVPGMPVFHNLTQGFRIEVDGQWMASCVDDITLQNGLDRQRPPLPGWFRIVSDDLRLLRLIQRHATPTGAIADALTPVADLFGVQATSAEGGLVRVADASGASVCLGAPLPGERERPCELVTAPLSTKHHAILTGWLEAAQQLGFRQAHEAAVHVHCDGAALKHPVVFQRLVRLWHRHGSAFRALVKTNPACMRLGPWPVQVVTQILSPTTRSQTWDELVATLVPMGLTKYCDLNIANLVLGVRNKPTVEFRVFPGSMDASQIVAFGHLAAAVCAAAVQDVDDDTLIDLPTLAPEARTLLEP